MAVVQHAAAAAAARRRSAPLLLLLLLLEIAKEMRAGGKCSRTECGTEPTAEVTLLAAREPAAGHAVVKW